MRNYIWNLLMYPKRDWYPWLEAGGSFMVRSFLIWSRMFVILVQFRRFRRFPLQPVVELTFENRFNDLVSLDLREHGHNQYWILYLIDTSARYSAARLIKTKKSEEIIHNIFLMWILYFGAPKQFLSNNRGGFNEGYQKMNKKSDIETCTPATESPFSNGSVEYHNLIVAKAKEKLLEDEKCKPEITLAWAASAKNALQNHSEHIQMSLYLGPI